MELTYYFPLFRQKFIYLFEREHIDHTTQSNTYTLFRIPIYIKHKVMIYSPSMINMSWKIYVRYHHYKDSPSQVSSENIDVSYGSQLAHLLLVKITSCTLSSINMYIFPEPSWAYERCIFKLLFSSKLEGTEKSRKKTVA